MRSRAALLAAALAVVLVPLLVIPMVRAREAPPERPGLDAVCPDLRAGGPSYSVPMTSADAAGREEALSQPVPADGGPATFTLEDSGGGGGSGGGSGTVPTVTPGTGSGAGTGTGSGSGAGSGSGTGAPGAPGSAGSSGPTTGPGQGTEPTGDDQPMPTVPPSEVAQEVTKEDVEETDSAPLPWPALLLLLLAAAAAAAYAMRRRRQDPAAAATESDGTAAAGFRRRPRPVGDDLEARVREAFVSGLLDLDRAGIVAYDESLPSSWIARRLGQSRNREAFGQASVTFDEIVYGRRPPSPEDIERIRAGFASILTSSPQ